MINICQKYWFHEKSESLWNCGKFSPFFDKNSSRSAHLVSNSHSVEIAGISVIQILPEISFQKSRSCNLLSLAILGAQLSIWSILAFIKWQNPSTLKFRALEYVEMADFALLVFPKLISHKIWMTEKSWNSEMKSKTVHFSYFL